MTIVNVNGVNLNYESAGQGDTIVFLHGYTGNTKDWARQFKVLSSKYRVIAMDGRGHGKSAAPTGKTRVPVTGKLRTKILCRTAGSMKGLVSTIDIRPQLYTHIHK